MGDIRATKQYLGIQRYRGKDLATEPIVLLTRWRSIAFILRLGGVYLLLCVFWIGWHYGQELCAELRLDYQLHLLQDGIYNSLMLIFLACGMSTLFVLTLWLYGRALRPLRTSAHRYRIHDLERVLMVKNKR